MSQKIINTRLQMRHDLAATFTSQNPVLLEGELGFEIDTKRFKVGTWNGTDTTAYKADGTATEKASTKKSWNQLPYADADLVAKDAELAAAIGVPSSGSGSSKVEATGIYKLIEELGGSSTSSIGELEDAIEAEVTARANADATKVDKEITSDAGKAMIFNEADGGGAKFEGPNNTASFVGVNSDTNGGIGAQLYDIDVSTNKGSKVDVTKGGVYYVKGDESAKTAAQRDVAANEIAVKGDISSAITALDLANTYAAKSLETTVSTHTADTTAHITATERTSWDGAATKAAANETAIGVLNGADTVTGSVAKAVKDAKTALVGASTDTKDSDTITGAKKYADNLDTAMDARVDAIESSISGAVTATVATLDYTDTAESGKFVTAVSEADGVISVTRDAVTASQIGITDTDNKITATTVEGALAELATSISNTATGGAVTCEKDTTQSGVAARYTFKQGGTAITNAVIDIPKDMVVSSGAVVTNPDGQTAGTYLVLTLANATNDKVYINVGDLIEYVTSGSAATDMVVVAIDADHKVTASITDGTVTLAKLASAVQTEINKAHEHSNKTELDLIASGDKAKWDAEIGAMTKATANETAIAAINNTTTGILKTAKDYADTLNTAMDTRVDALEALTPAEASAQVNVIESIKVEGASADLAISSKKVTLPLATAAAVGLVKADETSLEVGSNGVMSVKAVDVQKLFVADGDELVLCGGNA